MWTNDLINHIVVELKTVIALTTMTFMIETYLYDILPMNERGLPNFIKQQWCIFVMKGAPLGLVCNFFHPWWMTLHSCGFRIALCMVFSVTHSIVSWLLTRYLVLKLMYTSNKRKKHVFIQCTHKEESKFKLKKECRKLYWWFHRFVDNNNYEANTVDSFY